MKLIYIANLRLPTEKAHGIQIMKMCEAFAKSEIRNPKSETNSKFKIQNSKINIELVVPMRFNRIKQNPFEYYGVERLFKIRYLPCLDLLPLEKYLGKIAFFIQNLSFAICAALYTVFKKADIIFCRDLFSALALSIFRKNVCYEIHDSVPVNFWTAKFLKNISRFVSTNNYKKDELIRNFQRNSDKILVAPNGVDIEKFEIRNSKFEIRNNLGLPLNKKIVLYTGHLYEWKGAAVLLEAVRNFQFFPTAVGIPTAVGTISPPKADPPPEDNFQNILFVFVGGTEKDVELFKSNIQYPISNIQMVGHRPHDEIPYWLKAADVLVLPNTAKEKISQFETSPIKLFEYMASGTPIVASDIPSIREIVSEREVYFVQPDSPEELARGIKKLFDDRESAERISLNAREKVKEFTWRKRAQKIIDFLNL